MVVTEISSALERRRQELVDMLENNKEMKLEKQHQVYGAINEIDLFMQTLEYYQKTAVGTDAPIRLVAPPADQKGLFTKIFQGIKDKVKRN